jgi:hypothetical protein
LLIRVRAFGLLEYIFAEYMNTKKLLDHVYMGAISA